MKTTMASKPPLPSPDAASEGSQIEELPDGVYRKDLTEDQLSGFYAAAYTDHQQMIEFGLLHLPSPSLT